MEKILICGHKSFVATGLSDLLKKEGIHHDCFSRGEMSQKGNVITGPVMEMNNSLLGDNYDTVINFIILKGKTVNENIEYIKSLLRFCQAKHVKNLIQISSISVYPNGAAYIDEYAEIEKDYRNKGGYASIKVAVDHYLMDNAPDELNVIFVRPGFVYTKNREISKSGILISKFGMNLLLGNKKTSLPLICRETLHEALVNLIKLKNKPKVCLIFNKDRVSETKYNFVRNQWDISPICLPSWFFLPIARILKFIGIFKERHYLKVIGLFKRTWYNSEATEKALGVSFNKKEIAVIGAGTYGSYIATLLSTVYPHERIFLYDVGNEHLKTEEEIGYLSHILKAPYEGLQKARFFGYGGASAKWGGQLLTFSENDFKNPTHYMKGIIELNQKYKDIVLSKFGLVNKETDKKLTDGLFIKTGIWLSYFHRNLFKYFNVAKNLKIHIIPNTRIVKINSENREIKDLLCIQNGRTIRIHHDYYFLTTGAFESSRLLLNSDLSKDKNRQGFSDHLSQRAFKVLSGPRMGDDDFTFHVQGASLVTKRFVGEINGYSFYSQPICNEDFPFFQNLKKLLFGHHFSVKLITDLLKYIPYCIALAWSMIVLKKMYIYKNEFYLQIDIEAPKGSGYMQLSADHDKFGEPGIDVALNILPQTGELFTKARDKIKNYLDKQGVVYTELPFSTTAEKYEDVYHPFGMFCDFDSVEEYFTYFKNMLVVNTGILPRAGGINSTCAVLPLVEEFIHNKMK